MRLKPLLFVLCLFAITLPLNGQCLQGNCVNGNGVYRFSNGDLYVGRFDRMVPNGIGIMSYSEGQTREGVWSYGEFNNEVKTQIDSFALTELKTVYGDIREKDKIKPQKKEPSEGINWTIILAIITGIGIVFGIVEKSLNIREKIKKWNE